MVAVRSLCSRAIQLARGELILDSDTARGIGDYLRAQGDASTRREWVTGNAPGDALLTFRSVTLTDDLGQTDATFMTNKAIKLHLEFDLHALHSGLTIGFDLCTREGVLVFRSYQNDSSEPKWPLLRLGRNLLCCTIPAGLLNAGAYRIDLRVSIHCVRWIISIDSVVGFETELGHGESPFWNALSRGARPGCIAPLLPWVALRT